MPFGKRSGSKAPSINTEAPFRLALREPNADVVLLAYLSAIVSIVALFAFLFWQTMQPAVVRGAPLESALGRSFPGPILTTYGISEEAEQLAVETAEQENHDQQLQELEELRTATAGDVRKAIRAPSPVKPAQKRKPVARTRARDPNPANDPWQAWASSWGRDQWDRNRSSSFDRRERHRNSGGWNW